MYNVLIVEDQKIPRDLFGIYVKSSEDYNLLGSITSASVADIYCLKNHVDLVIMDIIMSDGSNGLDAAEAIKRVSPDTKIIAVTSTPDSRFVKKAQEVGVDSFWYKEYDETPFPEVMQKTMSGVRVYPKSQPILRLGDIDTSEFTEREVEIIRLVAEGYSNDEIAHDLSMAQQTVKNNINAILRKTGLRNRTMLACKARSTGFVAATD